VISWQVTKSLGNILGRRPIFTNVSQRVEAYLFEKCRHDLKLNAAVERPLE
jgi:hypothetical protein